MVRVLVDRRLDFLFRGGVARSFDPAGFVRGVRPPDHIRILLGSFFREKVREQWGQRQQLFFQSSASTSMDCSPAVLLLPFHFC